MTKRNLNTRHGGAGGVMKTKVKSASMEFLLTEILDGEYEGVWSSYTIKIELASCIVTLKTENGVRGINIPCTVTVKDGVVTARTE